MYEDLLKRLHAQELKMRRYHNIVGQPANRPLSLAGEAAAAIEALLAPKPEAPKKPAPKKPVPKKAGSGKEIGPSMAALRWSAHPQQLTTGKAMSDSVQGQKRS